MSKQGKGLLLALMLVVPGGAAAQSVAPLTAVAPASSMSEEIEIFRRLLNDKLRQQALTPSVASTCQRCHGTPMAGTSGDPTAGTMGLTQYYPPTNSFQPSMDTGRWLALTGYPVADAVHGPLYPGSASACTRDRLLDTEGVYLKGRGVVFTLTLAVPPRKETAEGQMSTPRPLSDWDRVRSEVRQEKPKAAEKSPPRQQPVLSEIILKAMAENGRHFTQLGENESLTVVATFRPGLPAVAPLTGTASSAAPAGISPMAWPFLGTFAESSGTVAAPGGLIKQGQGNYPTAHEVPAGAAAVPAYGAGPGSPTQDYELLGDLHRKQGKDQEAITAYQKALEQKPEPARAVKLQRKLAQVYLEQGKDAEAQRVLDALRQLLRSTHDSNAKPTETSRRDSPPRPIEAPRSLLPAKLVITAPKRLLDQAGSGYLSPNAFQKAVTVDYVDYPPEPK